LEEQEGILQLLSTEFTDENVSDNAKVLLMGEETFCGNLNSGKRKVKLLTTKWNFK